MRRPVLLFFLITAVSSTLPAQEDTFINLNGDVDGFGGPVIKATTINGQGALMVGGRGGWIFDHSFVIGGGAYGSVTEVDAPDEVHTGSGPLDIVFASGGLELEYVIQPATFLHYSFYSLLGIGTARFVKDVGSFSPNAQQEGETEFMFVVEPAANAEVSPTDWMRIAAGFSYRIAAGVNEAGLSSGDFSGPSAALTVKFGSF